MLAKLTINLEADSEEFGYYQSSNMQGILMEQIDSEYAELLHRQGMNPYSQFLRCDNGFQWIICTLTKEAYEHIILPLNNPDFSSFCIKKKNIQIKITKKELETISRKILLEEFYLSEGGRYLSLEFKTPTAFKQNGRYVNYPDIRLLFQSLMNKYGTGSYEMEMFDEETLEQLTRDITVSRYKLHSVMFPMEGIRIPAFMGNMTIQISGPKTMASYARMLVRFGEYSGVGIKTGMGMGGIRIIEGRKNDRREN